jgi:hypothetical protein
MSVFALFLWSDDPSGKQVVERLVRDLRAVSARIGVERPSVYEVPFMVQLAFGTDSWDAKKGSYAASALDVLRSVGRARSLKRHSATPPSL